MSSANVNSVSEHLRNSRSMFREDDIDLVDDRIHFTTIFSRTAGNHPRTVFAVNETMTTRGSTHFSFRNDLRMAQRDYPTLGHGVCSRDPFNCAFSFHAAQVHLVADSARGPSMANDRPWEGLFGLLSIPRRWRWGDSSPVAIMLGGERKATA